MGDSNAFHLTHSPSPDCPQTPEAPIYTCQIVTNDPDCFSAARNHHFLTNLAKQTHFICPKVCNLTIQKASEASIYIRQLVTNDLDCFPPPVTKNVSAYCINLSSALQNVIRPKVTQCFGSVYSTKLRTTELHTDLRNGDWSYRYIVTRTRPIHPLSSSANISQHVALPIEAPEKALHIYI